MKRGEVRIVSDKDSNYCDNPALIVSVTEVMVSVLFPDGVIGILKHTDLGGLHVATLTIERNNDGIFMVITETPATEILHELWE